MKHLKWTGKGTILKPAHEGDAGYDICSIEEYIVPPMQQAFVKTDVYIEIQKGYVGIIKEKSSLAKVGILSGAGVIDSSYRGEVKVLIRNFSDEPFEVKPGMKIAQIIFIRHEEPSLQKVDKLSDDTTRGVNGFGSTGAFGKQGSGMSMSAFIPYYTHGPIKECQDDDYENR
jgi:dUTP pyrophosphatase